MSHSLGRSSMDDPASVHSPQPIADPLRLADEWRACRIGDVVEIRSGETLVRRGVLESEMPDGSGIWIAANGVTTRSFFHKDNGMELWVQA
ncbi:hypothetical protein SB659_17165 [Arthrobacter sp. SIMBA_036]|uniref:hypothetical protein n=1 Tax=Arthrobacter sp. SIMBA_036 TaxID=3085778 RepID=UPI003978048C